MRIDFVLTWKKALGLLLLAGAAALAVSLSGLVSIAASSGHIAPWRWFLGWTLENAVRTQSIGVGPPDDLDLFDPALVKRGAGHFATGCAACHGAPGVPQSPVVLGMTPAPPRLEEAIGDWKDDELFWIVKHGIKYSGMPAWPTQERDDEVWAQVAFLLALPEMTPQAYADLALGGGLADDDTEAGGQTTAALNGIFENALSDCARCHGRDGLGQGEGAFPDIAGQSEAYLYATLRAFSLGARQSGFMQPPARRYEPEVLRQLARYFASQPAAGTAAPGAGDARAKTAAAPLDSARGSAPTARRQDEAGRLEGDAEVATFRVPSASAAGPPATRKGLLELGRRIALEGIPSRKIPACQSCHGAAGRAKNPFYPYLAGQPEWYLSEHLQLWKEGTRGGTKFAHVMDKIAVHMTEEQIEAVAAWYSEQSAKDDP
ncbi:Cytochrome c [Fulvimarina manganoxydans]|uniref:Cytochrome c n=1 Tax=Fulvimarina manganoxydans TaxID=937218 RepID=A0A1W2C4X4_9HYPH|nr:c-type cytochrome [Fulvimarina manganoxydans]MCK5931703.1 c-type cytochrome [Fulvimarina manganoxydans]SMC80259.1 Cytochrome c [Fulvimarina manganoxydans]